MKLALNCKTHDGKKETWVYDNTTNEILMGKENSLTSQTMKDFKPMRS